MISIHDPSPWYKSMIPVNYSSQRQHEQLHSMTTLNSYSEWLHFNENIPIRTLQIKHILIRTHYQNIQTGYSYQNTPSRHTPIRTFQLGHYTERSMITVHDYSSWLQWVTTLNDYSEQWPQYYRLAQAPVLSIVKLVSSGPSIID